MKKRIFLKRTIAYIVTIMMVVGILNGYVGQKEVKAAASIANNGLGGISINIAGAPYNDGRWNAYGNPYGPLGCTWFVGARVMQLTGRGSYNTQAPRTWWNSYGTSLGFSKGQDIKAPAVICFAGHVAFLEKIEGNTAYISEGGVNQYKNWGSWKNYASGNGYTAIHAITVGEIKTSCGTRSDFLGFVYLPSAPKPTPPATPSNVRFNKSDIGRGDVLTANWNASSGASRYNVTLTCVSNSAYNQSTSTGGTSASFTINNPGTYRVSVSASNSVGTSGTATTSNCTVHENVKVRYVDWENELIGKEQSIKWGGNANSPVPPEREGYTFQNWSSDGKNLKSDTTIIAQYKINTYSVSFVDYKGDQIGKTQKIEYKSAAKEPLVDEIPCKKGYIFAGWDTNEYKEVKKSLTIKATYIWENTDLPIITEIKKAKRNEEKTGYDVDINLTNFPNDFTKGKLVISLMTKEGKMVASETKSISMPKTGEVNENVTILYSGLAPRVKVSMIGVLDDETTGTPKATAVTSAVDIGNEWSEWSTEEKTGEDIISESRNEYRCKHSKVITANTTPSTPAGYILTKTVNTGKYTSWGPWSGWSRTYRSSNDLTDVQSQNGYRVYAFVCSCGRRDPFGGACSRCGKTLTWQQTEDTITGYQRGYSNIDEAGSKMSTKGRVVINAVSWYFELNGCSNGEPQSASVSGNGKGQVIYPIYRYRTRQEYKEYTFWQKEFEEWGPEKIDKSIDNEVEERVVYRFTTNNTQVPCYNYKRYRYTNPNTGNVIYTYSSKYADSMDYVGEWEYFKSETELMKIATVDEGIEMYNGTGDQSWYKADVNKESEKIVFETKETLEDTTGVKRTVEGEVPNAAGKVATFLVYKGQNTDPVASQIEYIGQVKIGLDGTYKFDFVTKEEPTLKTGDFVITLGLEGSTNYQVIGKIEAPKKTYNVEFLDDEGNTIGQQQKVLEGSNAEEPVAPEKEGYDFVGWDTSSKNIRENTVITAKYIKQKHVVVYVDWDNTSVDVKIFEHGQKLTMPDTTMEKEGSIFEKWVDENGNDINTVKRNMVVTAKYQAEQYTVRFLDEKGNIVSEQNVRYGESATVPDEPKAENENEVFEAWSTLGEELFVTRNMDVFPIMREKGEISDLLDEKLEEETSYLETTEFETTKSAEVETAKTTEVETTKATDVETKATEAETTKTINIETTSAKESTSETVEQSSKELNTTRQRESAEKSTEPASTTSAMASTSSELPTAEKVTGNEMTTNTQLTTKGMLTQNACDIKENSSKSIVSKKSITTVCKSKLSIKKYKKKKAGKVRVKWTMQTGVDGYEVQYALNKKFNKKLKKKTVLLYFNNCVTLKQIKYNKKYYIRVRAFKYNGTVREHYSWSNIKKVRILK